MMSSGAGYLSLKTSFSGEGVEIVLTASQMYAGPPLSLIVRSIAAFAAAEVSGRPVWNLTPLRSVNVQVLPPLLDAHLVARSGFTVFVAAS